MSNLHSQAFQELFSFEFPLILNCKIDNKKRYKQIVVLTCIET